MRPDENEIRSALKHRRSRTGTEVWPSIEARLETPPRQPAPTAVRWAFAAAVLVALAIGLKRTPEPEKSAPSVRVVNAMSLGRPAGVLVLEPDEKTVLVVLE